MKIIVLILMTLGMVYPKLSAQIEPCGQSFLFEQEEIEQPYIKLAKKLKSLKQSVKDREEIIIPVVFHVIHQGEKEGEGTNISQSNIITQIENLNNDFNNLNEDLNHVPPEFKNTIGNPKIRFCLASIDPNGKPTTGIVREKFGKILSSDQIEQEIKPATFWNTNKYLNIWSLKMPTEGVLGYAYPPVDGVLGSPRDGIVVSYKKVGNRFSGSQGRTLTHEIGHYLGLQHPWGAKANCNNDDGISDTPHSDGPYFFCPVFPQYSCGEISMYMNFMDYVDDECMVMFSRDQAQKMNDVLIGVRKDLGKDNLANCQNFDCMIIGEGVELKFDQEEGSNWKFYTSEKVSNFEMRYFSNCKDYSSAVLSHSILNIENRQEDFAFSPCFLLDKNWKYKIKIDYQVCGEQDFPLLEVGMLSSFDLTSFEIPKEDWMFENLKVGTEGQISLTFNSFSNSNINLAFKVVNPHFNSELIISKVSIEPVSGIDQEKLGFLLYPNPSKDYLKIDFEANAISPIGKVKIYDLMGRLVIENKIDGFSNVFNTKKLAPGVYIVEVLINETRTIEKLVVQ